MTDLITSAEYPAIRAALDTELDSDKLPDSIIALSIYKEKARQDVLKRDPDAESRTGDKFTHVQNAAIYLCAALLAPAVIRVTSVNVQGRDLSYQRRIWDPADKAAELRELAEQELAAVLTPTDDTPGMPTMFTVAGGTRGK